MYANVRVRTCTLTQTYMPILDIYRFRRLCSVCVHVQLLNRLTIFTQLSKNI
jgi:hypothetical protein